MGILDEAIREHLELKRQHGADDSELKQLEDDAFGPSGRPGDEEAAPDPFAEAPTEFMAAPEVGGEASAEVADEAPPKREAAPDIAALQEAPPSPSESAEEELEPVEEEQPAMEHEVVPEEPEPAGPSTEEREAIGDQPTEMYDVEVEIAAEESPSDEQLVEEEMSEPRLAPVDPLGGTDEDDDEVAMEVSAPEPEPVDEEEEEDDFWDEQRLSDELNQALEAPVEESEAVVEVEVEEEEIVEESEVEEEPEEPESPHPDRGDEDILEDTPDFLEDSEDDQLWFEQKPPKDFDFDD
jgi:hypothetical protein